MEKSVKGAKAQKEVRYCEHIIKGEARVYMRWTGPDYDVIFCWTCQEKMAPFKVRLDELTDRMKKLIG